MRYLTEVEASRVIALVEDGRSLRYAARVVGVSHSVILRLWHRYQETGSLRRRAGQGRKRKTTLRQDRFIVNIALRRRTSTARDLKNDLRRATGVLVSDQTARNRLREYGLNSRRPVRKPRLTLAHRRARLAFATQHINWTMDQWSSVLFSDESRFRLTRCDGRIRVWARRGERYSEGVVQETDRYGGGSDMVWAGISMHNRTDLVPVQGRLNAIRYIEEILADHLVPAAVIMGPGFLFQQDNARPHTAVLTRNFLEDMRIPVMEWPALSPDLNPIEHLWDQLDRRVRARPMAPATTQELTAALLQEWEDIPQDYIRVLILSMPRRCQAVILARGGHTRY